jgi:hypothetical protein
MKIRDQIKDSKYFELRIKILYEGIERYLEWIRIGKTPKERINIVKRAIVWDYISIVQCKYSSGLEISLLKNDLLNAIKFADESWDGFWKLRDNNDRILNQYVLSAYDEMLWMLSLGYLLNIPENDFKKLVDIIDRDQVKDKLFEFIISAKIKGREPLQKESYEQGWVLFSKLRQAIEETDKARASKQVKEFLEKDWYKEHKDVGWYNSHKSKHDTYFGYWSFESAAIVKIRGLDDSSFRDNQYYPKAFTML